jgi:Nif-specific regulatory protein
MVLQAKLLRFLQEREFERLGSTKTKKVDVRIVAATNRLLADAVAQGFFREDLYYRLNVFPIRVPPLRERREDLAPLINFFCDKISHEYGHAPNFTPAAMDKLITYAWPGNVRELENLIERLAIIYGRQTVDLSDLRLYLEHSRPATETSAQTGALKDREKQDLIAALQRHNGVQSRAAEDLGITLRQMGYKVKIFGLQNLVKPRGKSRKDSASEAVKNM